MEDNLTKCLAAFRKLYGTQHSLLTMLEKSKGELIIKHVSALFMDLSKILDAINHDLMLAKLKV